VKWSDRAASPSPDLPFLQLDLDFAMALKFLRRWPRNRTVSPPDPRIFAPASILLASEGSRIPAEALRFAADLSRESKAPVLVFVIARIWGSAFGLPHPSLMPTKREWQTQRELAAEAVDELSRRGAAATGKVVSSRNAAKRIVAEAKRRGPRAAIVMAAPPPRHRFIANFFWEQEPYRVRRLAESPVYLVVEEQPAALNRPASVTAGGMDDLALARPITEK
jgi:nucleotide-binding universal stress UspA family protein